MQRMCLGSRRGRHSSILRGDGIGLGSRLALLAAHPAQTEGTAVSLWRLFIPPVSPLFRRMRIHTTNRRGAHTKSRSVSRERWHGACVGSSSRELRRVHMLRSVCLDLVKASAVLVCVGVASSACWFRHHRAVASQDVRHEHRRDAHEEHHEEQSDVE